MARAFFCRSGLEITVQLTSHKRLVGFCLAVLEDHGVWIWGHDGVNVEELANERGGNGAILDPGRVREGQYLQILNRAVLLDLLVIVQRPLVNGNAQAVRGFLHHDRAAFRELIHAHFVVAVEIAIEDFHSILTFSPYKADRTADFD